MRHAAVIGDDNPFDRDRVRAEEGSVQRCGATLARVVGAASPVPVETARAHDLFRQTLLDPEFSCVGAKSALHRDHYHFGLYRMIDDETSTAALARDLYAFLRRQDDWPGQFSTFIACFRGPSIPTEARFEALLWAQLQRLHALDRQFHDWDPSASPDSADQHFSYSFAERAFFVVGMHPRASRLSRRFAWPTLVFNARLQFDRLRADGQYDRVREAIRVRERARQGSLNPMLEDFGVRSEARQYAGRQVEGDWTCPFQAESGSERP